MNEQDLRDCFALFITNGLLSAGFAHNAKDVWKMADKMIEARNSEPEAEVGIVAAKPKRRTKSA